MLGEFVAVGALDEQAETIKLMLKPRTNNSENDRLADCFIKLKTCLNEVNRGSASEWVNTLTPKSKRWNHTSDPQNSQNTVNWSRYSIKELSQKYCTNDHGKTRVNAILVLFAQPLEKMYLIMRHPSKLAFPVG